MTSVDRLVSLRLECERLRDRREVLQQRHEVLLATHHEFDHIRLTSKRRMLNDIERGAVSRDKLNQAFWKDSNDLMERLGRVRANSNNADRLNAARREMAAAAEAAYPEWQQQQARRRIQRIRELEQSEKAVAARQYQAQEAFSRERSTRALLMQRLQSVATTEANAQRDQEHHREEYQRQVDAHNEVQRRQKQEQHENDHRDQRQHQQQQQSQPKLDAHPHQQQQEHNVPYAMSVTRPPPTVHTLGSLIATSPSRDQHHESSTTTTPTASSQLPPPPLPQSSGPFEHSADDTVPHHHLHVFKATYDWQTVPTGAWVDPRLEQEIRNGARVAKIPSTWHSTIDVLLPSRDNNNNNTVNNNSPAVSTTAGTAATVTVQVERRMRLRDLTEAISLAIKRDLLASDLLVGGEFGGESVVAGVAIDKVTSLSPAVRVRVQSNGVSFDEYADVTVEKLGSDFYHARPEAEVIGNFTTSTSAAAATALSPGQEAVSGDVVGQASSPQRRLSPMSASPSSMSSRSDVGSVTGGAPDNTHNMMTHNAFADSEGALGSSPDTRHATHRDVVAGSGSGAASVTDVDSGVARMTLSKADPPVAHTSSGDVHPNDVSEVSQDNPEVQRCIHSVSNICAMLQLLQGADQLRALRASSNGTVGGAPDKKRVEELVDLALLTSCPDDDAGANNDRLALIARQSNTDVLCVATHCALQRVTDSILAASLNRSQYDGESELVTELRKYVHVTTHFAVSQAQDVMRALKCACQPPKCAMLLPQIIEHCRVLVRSRVVSLNTAARTYAELVLLPSKDSNNTDSSNTDSSSSNSDWAPLVRVVTSAIRCLADPDAPLVLELGDENSAMGDIGDSTDYVLAVGRDEESDSFDNSGPGLASHNHSDDDSDDDDDAGRTERSAGVSATAPHSKTSVSLGTNAAETNNDATTNARRGRRLSFDELLGGSPTDIAPSVVADGGGDTASRVNSILRRISTAGRASNDDDEDDSSIGSGFAGGGRTQTHMGMQSGLDDEDDEF